MDFGHAWTLAFAIPAALTLLMPGFWSLGVCTAVLGVGITVAFRDFEAGLNEGNDGPGSAFAALLFSTAYVGLACGAAFRLFVLARRRCSARRPQ